MGHDPGSKPKPAVFDDEDTARRNLRQADAQPRDRRSATPPPPPSNEVRFVGKPLYETEERPARPAASPEERPARPAASSEVVVTVKPLFDTNERSSGARLSRLPAGAADTPLFEQDDRPSANRLSKHPGAPRRSLARRALFPAVALAALAVLGAIAPWVIENWKHQEIFRPLIEAFSLSELIEYYFGK